MSVSIDLYMQQERDVPKNVDVQDKLPMGDQSSEGYYAPYAKDICVEAGERKWQSMLMNRLIHWRTCIIGERFTLCVLC